MALKRQMRHVKQELEMTGTARSAPELPPDVAKQFGIESDQNKPSASHIAAPKTFTQPETSRIDDEWTDAAVKDILTEESDELLRVQDEAPTESSPPQKRNFIGKIGQFFKAWWRNKWARSVTIILLASISLTFATIPKTRYAFLNTVGVRSSASVQVLDNSTQLPLKGVMVTLEGKKVFTNIKGTAKFTGLKLGPGRLTIQRLAFAPYTRPVIIGWGSNPLGTHKLEAVGTQYVVVVTDYLSGKPIVGAEAESNQGNALADKNGKIILTVDDTNVLSLGVQLRAEGYRTETATLDAATALTSRQPLVPASKTVFVSKQGDKYDVFSADLDGRNKKLLLAGTGRESGNISLVVSPDSSRAALVSQREEARDSEGFLLNSLTLIDISRGSSMTIDRAERIELVDWLAGRLVYRLTVAGASAANPQRSRLISYNYESNARVQLATANQFNSIVSADGWIYFAPSGTDPRASLGLFRIKPDGSARERLSRQEVWTGLRSAYNNLYLQAPEGWYTHTIGTKELNKVSSPPNFVSYFFAENPGKSLHAWVDTRDGKGVLLLRDAEGHNNQVASQDGLTYPLHWAGDKAIVYRVVTSQEAADYAVSPNGGEPRKIADVTPTYGYTSVH